MSLQWPQHLPANIPSDECNLSHVMLQVQIFVRKVRNKAAGTIGKLLLQRAFLSKDMSLLLFGERSRHHFSTL